MSSSVYYQVGQHDYIAAGLKDFKFRAPERPEIVWVMPRGGFPNVKAQNKQAFHFLKEPGVFFLLSGNGGKSEAVFVGQDVELGAGVEAALQDVQHQSVHTVILLTRMQGWELNQAKVMYLQGEFIKQIRLAGVAKVVNHDVPTITVGDIVVRENMNQILNFTSQLLKEAGYDLMGVGSVNDADLEEPGSQSEEVLANEATMHLFRPSQREFENKARLLYVARKHYVLLKGAFVRAANPQIPAQVDYWRKQQERRDFIENDRTTCDLDFTSPTAALNFVLGTSESGQSRWVLVDDPSVTLGEFLDQIGVKSSIQSVGVQRAVKERSRSNARVVPSTELMLFKEHFFYLQHSNLPKAVEMRRIEMSDHSVRYVLSKGCEISPVINDGVVHDKIEDWRHDHADKLDGEVVQNVRPIGGFS